jgi:hypothetical protein
MISASETWMGLNFGIRSRQSVVNLFSAEKFADGGIVPPSAVRLFPSGPDSHARGWRSSPSYFKKITIPIFRFIVLDILLKKIFKMIYRKIR